MFLINENTPITTELIAEYINKFRLTQLPKLNRYWNYYSGNQDILRKVVNEDWHPNNKVVSNFCQYIVHNFTGYLTGNDITYTSDNDIEAIQDILNYNDVATHDSELLKNALIYGVAYEINYMDEDGKQRFAGLDSRQVIPIYYNSLGNELAAIIRFYPDDMFDVTSTYTVELYLPTVVFVYRSDNSLSTFTLIEDRPNFFGQVPISVFKLNPEETSVFDAIMSLQDAYNMLLSGEVDDYIAFCQSYLALMGFDADEETIKTMKENRVLIIPDGGEVKYVEKNPSNQQIVDMLDNVESKIFQISGCPNFADESFGTSSGIAMRYKLLGFENKAGEICKTMTKVLQRRIELICSVLSLSVGEEVWRDVQIVFTRNLPVDASEIIAEINGLRGLVSDKTLLSQVPFVQDVDTEMEEVKAQKEANVALYNFNAQEEN